MDYRTTTGLNLAAIVGLAFGGLTVLCMALLLVGRRAASGVIGVVVGFFMVFVMHALAFPWSVLPGTSVFAGGLLSLVTSANGTIP